MKIVRIIIRVKMTSSRAVISKATFLLPVTERRKRLRTRNLRFLKMMIMRANPMKMWSMTMTAGTMRRTTNVEFSD